MTELVRNRAILRKRLLRLLWDNRRIDRPELVNVVLPKLESVGRLLLIGGAVRDVARSGGNQFKSDLDIVVYDLRRDAFLTLMQELGGSRNRFGGYALAFSRWKIDIWALEDTWARTAGLVKVEQPVDLLNCTFFDWDAVLFDLQSARIISKPDYLETLASGILDINLEENPNPRGSLVRALRRGALWKVLFGPKLTRYARRGLEQEAWEHLVALDQSAFAHPVLRHLDPERLRNRLRNETHFAGKLVTEPFGPFEKQTELVL